MSEVPYVFDTRAYKYAATWFDSEDVIAALSLPLIESLSGKSPRFRSFIMGFINQILSRNLVSMVGGNSMNTVTLHSVKSLLAGALTPIENYLWWRKSLRSEGFFREMSRGTVASLIAGAGGSMIGDQLPGYL